jgi:hypothetical protein
MKTAISLQWEGIFIEYCVGRIHGARKNALESINWDSAVDLQSVWYENTRLLQSIFEEDHWWAVDDLEHAMGFVFDDRSSLETHLSDIVCKVDGSTVNIDPNEFQMSFYAPEPLPPIGSEDIAVCHGCLRQATMSLRVELDPPVDPSRITLSFINYPDIGLILIDMDIDGHDELEFDWGETTYLQPRFLGKDEINGITG